MAFLTATLVVIDVTLAGLYWAMGGHEDVIARLIKKTLYIGTFAFIITNFSALSSMLFRSFAGLGLLATGSQVSPADFLHPGRLASIGVDAARPILHQIGDLTGFPEVFLNLATHRGAVPRLAGGDRQLLHPGGAALRHADRVQAHHPRRLHPGAVCAVESHRVSRRARARQRRVRRRQGAGTRGDRRHRQRDLQRLSHRRSAAEPSVDQALAIMLASLALLGLGIFGPGIATGLVSGGPQLGAGAAVGTAMGAAGLAVAGAAAIRGGAQLAARGGAALRSASSLAARRAQTNVEGTSRIGFVRCCVCSGESCIGERVRSVARGGAAGASWQTRTAADASSGFDSSAAASRRR